MRTSVKFIAFLLAFCMLAGSFSVFAFAEGVTSQDNSAGVPKTDDSELESPFYDISCVYDRATSLIKVDFRMKNENVRKYEKSTAALYRLVSGETVDDVKNDRLSPIVTDIRVANRTGCEVRQVGLLERLSKYVIAIKSENGSIVCSEPFFAGVSGQELKYSFKGAELGNVNSTLNAFTDTAIIDVPLERLESTNGGYLYHTEHKTYTFGHIYLDELDRQMEIYSGAGVNVYLRFSESRGFPIISSGSAESLPTLYAYASFLTERYAADKYGGVFGIILGDSDHAQTEAYADVYADSLYAIAASLEDKGYKCPVIVPVGDIYKSSAAFLTKLCSYYSGVSSQMFSVMLEGNHNPYGITKEYTDSYDAIFYPDEFYGSGEDFSDDDKLDYDSRLEAGLPKLSPAGSSSDYISSENVTRLLTLIRRLKNETGCISESVIYHWTPSNETTANAALAAFVYNFYKLLFTDKVLGFIVSFNDDYDSESRATVEKALKYIDSDKSDKQIDKERLASYFGNTDFESLIFGFSDSKTVKRDIYNPSAVKNKPLNIIGQINYFDFSETSGQSGWYAGNGCVSISSVKDSSSRHLSAKMISGENEASFVAHNYKYSESFEHTDYIAIEFMLECADESKIFDIGITLGGDGFACEYKSYGFFPNVRYTVYIDTMSLDAETLTDYIRIGASEESNAAVEYQFKLYSIDAMSKKYDNDELSDLVEAERERLKSSADDALKNDIEYTGIVFVVFIVLLTFILMFMLSKRQRSKKHKKE